MDEFHNSCEVAPSAAPKQPYSFVRKGCLRSLVFFRQRWSLFVRHRRARTCVKELKNSGSSVRYIDSLFSRSFARSLVCSPSGASARETFTTGISVTAATRWRTDVWKTIIRNARCANPYNVQLRIYFRAFGSSLLSASSAPRSPRRPSMEALGTP